MALKAYIKTLEEVDEKFRDQYVKNEDGTFRLDADGIEDISALKNALNHERERNKKGGKDGAEGGEKLTKAEKEELENLRREREDKERDRLKKENDWKGLEARLHDDYTKKLKAAEEKATKVSTRFHRSLLEAAATQAIVKNKGRVAPLLPHVLNNLAVIEDGDDFKVIVKDKDGQPRYSKDNPRDVMSVEELIKSDYYNNDDFMGVFEGKGHSGSGASGGANGRGAGGAVTISREEAKDSQKYRAAKEQAAKSGVELQILSQ